LTGGAHVRGSITQGVVVVHRIDVVYDTVPVRCHDVDERLVRIVSEPRP
jgi:hypothetical protein